MRRRSAAFVACLALLVAVAAWGAWMLLRASAAPRVEATIVASEALGGADTAGFARATAVRPFRFPEDHGPHPAFRNEWWYFTGNLDGPGGRRVGYQLTLFRIALTPEATQRASEWATNQVYMAHFALTDVRAGRFHAYDRFARGAVGLAGARSSPFRVWLEDWAVEGAAQAGAVAPSPLAARVPARGGAPPRSQDPSIAGAKPWPDAPFPLHLRAAEGDTAIELRLGEGKPPALQGDRGLSRKSAEPGNASYYYSLTRMPTAGTVRIGADTFRVSGASWMDREWSTSALSRGEVGWDWFALQLGDGRDLMFYRIRRKAGGVSPFSAGSVVAADGGTRPLAASDVAVEVLDHWTSPTGVRYPSRWRLRVASAGLDLDIRPVLANQELNVSVRYWEGAVDVTGTSDGKGVRGRGYVELTGYGDRVPTPSAGGR